ncbi:MAG: hypothetical protein AABW52_01705 [Nanoarchaeota archaeon]
MGALEFQDLEYLARASDNLTNNQRNKFLELAKRDPQGALRYFYSLEGNNPYKHISTETKVAGKENLRLGDILEAVDELDYNTEEIKRNLQKVKDYVKDDERLTRLLEHLISRSSLDAITEFVEDLSLDDVRNKLEILANKLVDDDGVVVIPKRIVSVDFGDVLGVRTRRDYKGDPLTYFSKNYGPKKLTRAELKNLDSALYRALLRYGFIDKAIPEFMNYTPADRKKIHRAHAQFNGNAAAASRSLRIPDTRILSYWKEYGLSTSKTRYPPEKKNEILLSYNTYNGSYTLAARALFIPAPSVQSIWRRAGLI